jgi:hypothetical protein
LQSIHEEKAGFAARDKQFRKELKVYDAVIVDLKGFVEQASRQKSTVKVPAIQLSHMSEGRLKQEVVVQRLEVLNSFAKLWTMIEEELYNVVVKNGSYRYSPLDIKLN